MLNQTRAFDNTRYANRGTELWFNFKLFVENNQVSFLEGDTIFESQLTNRYFRIQKGTGKLMIEPKVEAKAKGHPSPDRADATVLAWANLFYPCDDIELSVNPPKPETGITKDNLALILREQRHQFFAAYKEPETTLPLITDHSNLANFRQDKIVNSLTQNQERKFGRRLLSHLLGK